MGRSILAVVGGFASIVLVVLISTFAATALMLPPAPAGELPQPTGAYLGVNLLSGLVAAVLGGYLAGRLAAHRPLMHAAVLAAVLIIMSIISAASGSEASAAMQPGWYSPAIAVIGVVGVIAGGWLRRRQLLDPIVA